jgi:hypothetical protein
MVTIIPYTDQYKSNGINLFRYKYYDAINEGTSIKTDIAKDFNNNTIIDLKDLARVIRLKDYSKLKKADLVNLLNQEIKFETKEETERRLIEQGEKSRINDEENERFNEEYKDKPLPLKTAKKTIKLENYTVKELKQICKDRGITRYSQ